MAHPGANCGGGGGGGDDDDESVSSPCRRDVRVAVTDGDRRGRAAVTDAGGAQGGSYSCSHCPCVVDPPAAGLGFIGPAEPPPGPVNGTGTGNVVSAGPGPPRRPGVHLIACAAPLTACSAPAPPPLAPPFSPLSRRRRSPRQCGGD